MSKVNNTNQSLKINPVLLLGLLALTVAGVAAFLLQLKSAPKMAWAGYLLSFWYVLALAMMATVFTGIFSIAKSGWQVAFKRVLEGMSSFMPIAAILALGILVFGVPHLYHWSDSHALHDAILAHKAPFLNFPFFSIRSIIYFSIWIGFAVFFIKNSLAQDADGVGERTIKIIPKSALFLILFALSYSFASFDYIMSVEPHWFSTMYGVYMFAGMMGSGLAMLILILALVKKLGYLPEVNENHFHNIAQLLIGFTIFWMYIWFSQFMLIWYANIPEETMFFIPRLTNGWQFVLAALIVLHWLVPFFMLLPRPVKRSVKWLVVISTIITISQFIDLFFNIFPSVIGTTHGPALSLNVVLMWLGALSFFVLWVLLYLSRVNLIAKNDPLLEESLHLKL
jgi:hypothetical protein